jgi:hypothetical protein
MGSAFLNPIDKFRDGFGLVALRLKFGNDPELVHTNLSITEEIYHDT